MNLFVGLKYSSVLEHLSSASISLALSANPEANLKQSCVRDGGWRELPVSAEELAYSVIPWEYGGHEADHIVSHP